MLLPPVVTAQSGYKGIYIVNAQTKIPLQDVCIHNEILESGITTDDDGFANLNKISETVKDLIITSIGYQSVTIKLSDLTFINPWVFTTQYLYCGKCATLNRYILCYINRGHPSPSHSKKSMISFDFPLSVASYPW